MLGSGGLGALDLAQRGVPSKLEHGFHLGHGVQLVGDPLEPVVGCLDHAGHFRHLPANHWVLDEGLAEGLALAGKRQGVFEADAGEACAHGTEREALVVEVLHHVLEAHALFAEKVALRHLDLGSKVLRPFQTKDAGLGAFMTSRLMSH